MENGNVPSAEKKCKNKDGQDIIECIALKIPNGSMDKNI